MLSCLLFSCKHSDERMKMLKSSSHWNNQLNEMKLSNKVAWNERHKHNFQKSAIEVREFQSSSLAISKLSKQWHPHWAYALLHGHQLNCTAERRKSTAIQWNGQFCVSNLLAPPCKRCKRSNCIEAQKDQVILQIAIILLFCHRFRCLPMPRCTTWPRKRCRKPRHIHCDRGQCGTAAHYGDCEFGITATISIKFSAERE